MIIISTVHSATIDLRAQYPYTGIFGRCSGTQKEKQEASYQLTSTEFPSRNTFEHKLGGYPGYDLAEQQLVDCGIPEENQEINFKIF